jgi:hypothetical protein
VGTVKSTTSRALERLRGVVEGTSVPTNGNDNGDGNEPRTPIITSVSNGTELNVRKDTCLIPQAVRTNEGSTTP